MGRATDLLKHLDGVRFRFLPCAPARGPKQARARVGRVCTACVCTWMHRPLRSGTWGPTAVAQLPGTLSGFKV